MAEFKHDNWKGNTGGQPWMQRSLVAILGAVDQRLVYIVVAFVVPFYMVFSPGFADQYYLFRNRLHKNVVLSFWNTYINYLCFGMTIVDRFAVFGGRKFDFETEDFQDWYDLEEQPKGFVQLTSHVGNFEIAGYSYKPKFKKVFALVFSGETQTVMENRARVFSVNNVYMVPVSPDMSHIFELNSALADGNVVGVPGDRLFGSSKSVTSKFFGEDVSFPVGGLSLAVSRGCPVLAVFSMKVKWNTYRLFCYNLTKQVHDNDPDATLKKSTYIQALSDAYAEKLELMVRRYPSQWFNYYDIWKSNE